MESRLSEAREEVVIAAVVDQWIGLGLIAAFFLVVIRDQVLAIAGRHVEPTAEDVGQPREEKEPSAFR